MSDVDQAADRRALGGTRVPPDVTPIRAILRPERRTAGRFSVPGYGAASAMPGGSPRGCPASPLSTVGSRPTDPPVTNETTSPVCSAKGCRATATWVLAWNNPKLHAPERRKTWTACDTAPRAPERVPGDPGLPPQTVPYGDWPADADVDDERSAADRGHRPGRLQEAGVVDAVAGQLREQRGLHPGGELVVGGAGPHRGRAGRTPRGRTGSCAADRRRSAGPGRRRRRTAGSPSRSRRPGRARRRPATPRPARCRAPRRRPASASNDSASRAEDLVGGDHRRRGPSRAGRPAASAR